MSTQTITSDRPVRALSPMVAQVLCMTFSLLFAQFTAAANTAESGSKVKVAESIDEEEEEEEEEEDLTGGLVWIVETEVIQIDLPSDFSNDDIESTGINTFRDSSAEAGAQWFGFLFGTSAGFIDMSLLYERNREPMQNSISESFIELNELWIETSLPSINSSIRSGLQNFEDERSWWWDEELVGVQWLGHTHSRWRYSAAALALTDDISTLNEPTDPEERDIFYLLLQGHTELGESSTLSVFGLHSTDQSGTPARGTQIQSGLEDEADADLTHLGLGITHEVDIGRLGSINIRGDFAILTGNERSVNFAEDEEDSDEENEQEDGGTDEPSSELNADSATEDEILSVTGETRSNIDAWALDVGIGWQLPIVTQPFIELGLARGSGTSAEQPAGSKTFRQSGLHDNGRDRGTYGNVFVPDLSNLQVLSIAASIPLTRLGELSIYHHRFSKLQASDELTENELDFESESNSTDIGNETGLYLQLDVFDDIEINLGLSQFRFGRSLESTSSGTADRFSIEFTYEF